MWIALVALVLSAGAASGCSDDAASDAGTCDHVLPTTSAAGDGFETMHTVLNGDASLSFSLVITPGAACPGDTVSVTVHIANAGATVAAYEPVLSMTCPGDSITKLLVANLGHRDVEPGSATATGTFQMPACAPGSTEVFVYGGSGRGARLQVLAPHTQPS